MTNQEETKAEWSVEQEIKGDKELRQWIDNSIQVAKTLPTTRERALAITKLQEAVMWLGMDLKRIGELEPDLVKDPYPNSKDPTNAIIDKTADGLKF